MALVNRGETLETIGHHDRAIRDSTGSSSSIPATRRPITRAAGLQRQARIRPRHRRLQPGDQARRQAASAYNNRGIAYRAKGEKDRAIADFSMAARIDPNYALAYSNRGNAYFDKHEYDLAIGDLNLAIKLNPNYVRAYYDRGIAYGAKGDTNHAIADFDMRSNSTRRTPSR